MLKITSYGDVMRFDLARTLAAKMDHLETLGRRVQELDRQGVSVPGIVRALCGGPMLIELITLGHFTRRHLVRSYLKR